MKVKLGIAAVALLAALAGFFYWNQSRQRQALISEATPDIPVLEIASPVLLQRIQKSTTQAKSGPDALAGLQMLSRLYNANGFTNQAWQCYSTLIAVDPGEAKWPYHLARILAGYGQLVEATPLFQKAAALAPSYIPAHFRLGETLLKQNRYEEAADSFQRILQIDGKNAYARVGLARIAIAREDWAGARSELEKAVADSNFQIGADLLGDVYEKLGLSDKEQIVLQNIRWGSYADIPDDWSLDLMNDSYDAYQVSVAGGWVLHRGGDTRTGLQLIKRAVDLDPDSFMLHYQIAGVYESIDQIDDAEKHYKRCVELQPDFADAWLKLIEIANQRKNPTLAKRTLDAALRAAPNSPSLNIERGKLLLAQKRFDLALPYFKRSIELRPQEAVGYIELAQAYLSEKRVEEGMEQMRRALAVEPTHLFALSTMAFDAVFRGDQAEADSWFSKLAEQPRIKGEAISRIVQFYQQEFGSPPPR